MISEYLIRFLFHLLSLNPTIGSEQLTRTREDLRRDLDHLNNVLDNLDELGDIMVLMLTTQDSIEVFPYYSYLLLHNTNLQFFLSQEKAEASLDSLYHHLLTLEHLHERYVAYRMAFNKLILEIGRRRQYREAAENIVKGMMKQLESMTEGNCFNPLLSC
jgi:autophagy-related protein 17